MKIKLIAITFFLMLNAAYSFALNDDTHRSLNEAIATNSTTNAYFNDYLNKNLGFTKGVEESINGQAVYLWLGDGGYYEDIPPLTIPYLRSFNHFHNPITNQGFNAVGLGWYSSVQWALMPVGGQIPGGHYSWYDTRNYYRAALTSSSKAERDTNFADTFRGVGQLMHLVQDASVPAHTRNDAHVWYNSVWPDYEIWVKNNPGVMSSGGANPVFFTGQVNSIASFIDTNQYNGANPSATVSTSMGLSEYTNANFASEDTIFSGNFPYPRTSSMELYFAFDPNRICIGLLGVGCFRPYLKKVSDGEIINHFAVPGRLYKYLGEWPEIQREFVSLDDNCYKDYAAKLIPRAVGYSAGLINYFFRGQIDMKPDTGNKGKYIIENLSNEPMSGTFSLYYDDKSDNRNHVENWNLSIGPGGKSGPIGFTEPISPEPKEKGKYVLVFNGALGMEQGAVAGKVVSLERKRWEDWNEGTYELLSRWYSPSAPPSLPLPNELFFFRTPSRDWEGWWFSEKGHEPTIEAEDGILKAKFRNPNYGKDSFAGTKGWLSTGTHMPVKGCKISMSIPSASSSGGNDYEDIYSWIILSMRNNTGEKTKYATIYYKAIDIDTKNRVSLIKKKDWDWMVGQIFTGGGIIERSIEGDLKTIAGKLAGFSIGDITEWYIYDVSIRNRLHTINHSASLSLAIDYIDFECE